MIPRYYQLQVLGEARDELGPYRIATFEGRIFIIDDDNYLDNEEEYPSNEIIWDQKRYRTISTSAGTRRNSTDLDKAVIFDPLEDFYQKFGHLLEVYLGGKTKSNNMDLEVIL